MIHLQAALSLAGVLFLAVALLIACDVDARRRWEKAAFWGLFGLSFLLGDRLGDVGNGMLVLALVGLGAAGALSPRAARPAPAAPTATSSIFLPILIVPALTFAGSLLLPQATLAGHPLVDPKQATVIAMAGAVVVGSAVAVIQLRPRPLAPLREGRRVIELIGWAAILPQLLAALGAVFAAAGVGHAIGELLRQILPDGSRPAVVAIYCVGMALFTGIVGNAFAAFPVLVAGMGAPILIARFGGDPAVVGAVGMLSGYCGTLVTPMASHNIVPAALLGLRPGEVIRAQAPTALIVLFANILLLNGLAFR